MTDRLLALIALALALLALALVGAAPAHAQHLCREPQAIDGDTIRCNVEVWPGIFVRPLVRLKGIDAPELKARCPEEALAAEASKQALANLLKQGPVLLYDVSPDKYAGRVDANVVAGGVDLGATMIVNRHARAYSGGARRPWCP